MADTNSIAADIATVGLHTIEDYAPLIGAAGVERILKKARRPGSVGIGNVSSTLYGGGVAEILTPLTLLMNTLGISTAGGLVRLAHPGPVPPKGARGSRLTVWRMLADWRTLPNPRCCRP